MFIVIEEGPDQVIAQQEHEAVIANVVYATLLHDQKYADLKGLIEIDMVSALNTTKALGFDDEFKSSARLVRGYYDLPGTEMPSPLASSLANVKGTDVRRLASFMGDPKNVRAVRDTQ
jgi:hypothetical protein